MKTGYQIHMSYLLEQLGNLVQLPSSWHSILVVDVPISMYSSPHDTATVDPTIVRVLRLALIDAI